MQKLKAHPTLWAELPCFFFLIDKKEKRIYLNRVNPLNPNFWTSQSCFLSSNWFFDCKRLFIDKQVIVTGPAVPLGTRLLDLGSKLFPSNIQRMLNKNLTRFMHNLLKSAFKNWAGKRKFQVNNVLRNMRIYVALRLRKRASAPWSANTLLSFHACHAFLDFSRLQNIDASV